jgi:hypothetical protein
MLVYDIMRLPTYEAALNYVQNTKPIRSSNNTYNVRPLGGRRYWDAKWIRESNGVIEAGTYHNEPTVRFFPDNRIEILHGRWGVCNRQILGALFRGVLGITYANNRKFYMTDLASKTNYIVRRDEPLILHFDGKNYVGKTEKESKPYVRRKPMADIRKQYAAFSEYVHTMNKLAGGIHDHERRGLMINADFEKLFMNLRGKEMEGNEEAFQLCYTNMANDYAVTHWERGVGYVNRLSTERINGAFTNLFKELFSEEVMEMRVVPNSTVVK